MLTDYIPENAWMRRADHDELHPCWADAGFVMANGGGSSQSCLMKFTEYVLKHAADLGSAEKERQELVARFVRHHRND